MSGERRRKIWKKSRGRLRSRKVDFEVRRSPRREMCSIDDDPTAERWRTCIGRVITATTRCQVLSWHSKEKNSLCYRTSGAVAVTSKPCRRKEDTPTWSRG